MYTRKFYTNTESTKKALNQNIKFELREYAAGALCQTVTIQGAQTEMNCFTILDLPFNSLFQI